MIVKRGTTSTLALIVFISFAAQLQGQVTIGSTSDPRGTTLLELKENDNTGINSTKGLLYPRVELRQIDMLYPMYTADDADYQPGTNKPLIDEMHTGLTVYNMTDNATFSEGIYQWDGNIWQAVNNFEMLPITAGNIDCQNIKLYPETYKAGVPYKGVLVVPYFDGNGGYYTSATITNNNNFTMKLRPGKLNNGYGELTFEVTSNAPLFSSPKKTKISLSGLLNAACTDISIGGEERGLASRYRKKTGRVQGRIGGKTWDATYFIFNHLRMGYRYSTVPLLERVQWGTTANTNLTYYWVKSGDGGLDYWSYGQVASGANSGLSGLSEFDSGTNTSEGGPYGNKPNMRHGNRDIGQAWMMFHYPDNKPEFYRVTLNAHNKLDGTQRGYVTFFTEFME